MDQEIFGSYPMENLGGAQEIEHFPEYPIPERENLNESMNDVLVNDQSETRSDSEVFEAFTSYESTAEESVEEFQSYSVPFLIELKIAQAREALLSGFRNAYEELQFETDAFLKRVNFTATTKPIVDLKHVLALKFDSVVRAVEYLSAINDVDELKVAFEGLKGEYNQTVEDLKRAMEVRWRYHVVAANRFHNGNLNFWIEKEAAARAKVEAAFESKRDHEDDDAVLEVQDEIDTDHMFGDDSSIASDDEFEEPSYSTPEHRPGSSGLTLTDEEIAMSLDL